MKLEYNLLIYDDDDETIYRIENKFQEVCYNLGLEPIFDYKTEDIEEDIKNRNLKKYDLILLDLNFGTGEENGADNKGKEYRDLIRTNIFSTTIIFYTSNTVETLIDASNQGVYTVHRDNLQTYLIKFINEHSDSLLIKDYFRDYCGFFEDAMRKQMSIKFSGFDFVKRDTFSNGEKSNITHLKEIVSEKYDALIDKDYISVNDVIDNHEIYTHSRLTRAYQRLVKIDTGNIPNDNIFNNYRLKVLPIRNEFSHSNISEVRDLTNKSYIEKLDKKLTYKEIISLRRDLLEIKDEIKLYN